MAEAAEEHIDPTPWKGLRGKQKPWLRAYLDEGSKTFLNGGASAEAANYNASSVNSFRVIGSQNLIKLNHLINQWMDDFGLSEDRLKRKLKSLTEAKQTKFIKLKGAASDEDLDDNVTAIARTGVIVIQNTPDGPEEVYGDGETLLAIEEEAQGIQIKALELGMKTKKMLTDKIEIAGLGEIAERILAGRKRLAANE